MSAIDSTGINIMIDTIKKYGIDAPNVVKYLLICSFLTFLLSTFTFFIQNQMWFWIIVSYTLLSSLSLLVTALLILYSSVILKPKILSKILTSLELKGDEQLLDLGCGRGAFLIKAAKKLPKGKIIGIDLWNSKDQLGNCLEKTQQNISSEKLEKNTKIITADICSLPFPNSSFDIIISSLAIHNISDPIKQNQAIEEIIRVLKPSGHFAIFDILNIKKYACYFHNTIITTRENVFYCPRGTILIGRKKTL
jgi:arsenite methyltransferase